MMSKSSSKRTLLSFVICILIILICAAPVFAHGKSHCKSHEYIGTGEKYNIQTTYQYIDSNYHKQIQTGSIRYPVYRFYNGKWHFDRYLEKVDSFRTENNWILHRIDTQTGRCMDCNYQIYYPYNYWDSWDQYNNYPYYPYYPYGDSINENGPPSIPPPPR